MILHVLGSRENRWGQISQILLKLRMRETRLGEGLSRRPPRNFVEEVAAGLRCCVDADKTWDPRGEQKLDRGHGQLQGEQDCHVWA